MKKPAYGLNDAPRRWWNILDSALRSYGLVPTRADRCTYVYYGKQLPKPALVSEKKSSTTFSNSSKYPRRSLEYAILTNRHMGSKINAIGQSRGGSAASFHVALPDKAMCTMCRRVAASVSSRACAASNPKAVRSHTSGAKSGRSKSGDSVPSMCIATGSSEYRGASVHSLKKRSCSTGQAWVALHFRRVRLQNKNSSRFDRPKSQRATIRSQNPLQKHHVTTSIAPQESWSLSVALRQKLWKHCRREVTEVLSVPANCASCAQGPSAALRVERTRTGNRWQAGCRSKPVGQQRQASDLILVAPGLSRAIIIRALVHVSAV